MCHFLLHYVNVLSHFAGSYVAKGFKGQDYFAAYSCSSH